MPGYGATPYLDSRVALDVEGGTDLLVGLRCTAFQYSNSNN